VKQICFFFSVLLLIAMQLLRGQTIAERSINTDNQIKSLLSTQLGGLFHIECLADMDSLYCSNWVASGLLGDPYGTLKHCFPFVVRLAQKDSSGFEYIIPGGNKYKDSLTVFGIFRDGQIVWMTTSIKASIDEIGTIYGISDINQDGKVEIMIDWTEKTKGDDSNLWIFTWDGMVAAPIFQIGENGISSLKNVIKAVDLNGDGIMELLGEKGVDPENRSEVTYSWNGNKYGLWPNPPDHQKNINRSNNKGVK
jgi:hypothetical protein